MTELDKFKERWSEIICQCLDTPPHQILEDAIDELASCVPDWTEEGYVVEDIEDMNPKDDFMDNLGKLNKEWGDNE